LHPETTNAQLCEAVFLFVEELGSHREERVLLTVFCHLALGGLLLRFCWLGVLLTLGGLTLGVCCLGALCTFGGLTLPYCRLGAFCICASKTRIRVGGDYSLFTTLLF